MEAKVILKYKKYTLSQLKEKATTKFNQFIRERDYGNCCISCGQPTELQAGHFYSGGNYPALKFFETNVHGQCMKCNYYLSGNLLEYRKNLANKIGVDALNALDEVAAQCKRVSFKWDRFRLIEIIEKYLKLKL